MFSNYSVLGEGDTGEFCDAVVENYEANWDFSD